MDEPIRLNTRDAMIILTLIGIGIGLVLGLVPLIYGRIKGKAQLGVIGFITSIVSGAILGILPLFVMITFIFLIFRNPVSATPSTLPSHEDNNVS